MAQICATRSSKLLGSRHNEWAKSANGLSPDINFPDEFLSLTTLILVLILNSRTR